MGIIRVCQAPWPLLHRAPTQTIFMNGETPPSVPRQNNKLSVTSLVLGIFSFPCFFFAGIPAVITGHIALNRATKDPAQFGGKGMAIAGLIMGYLGIALSLVAVPASLLLPAL